MPIVERRDRDRQQDRPEGRRRGDEQLEHRRPSAAAGSRRPRRRSSIDQMPITVAPSEARAASPAPLPAPIHEEGERRVEERPDRGQPSRRRRSERACLTWITQPEAHDAENAPHAAVTSWTYASSSVGSREETRPIAVPFSCERIACVSSRPGAVCTISSCFCSCSSTMAARTPSSACDALDGELVDAEDLDLDDAARLDAAPSAPAASPARRSRRSRSPRSGRRASPPRTCSASSAARSCRPRSATRSVARSSRAPTGSIADRRLVEEEDGRVVQQAARDVQPLPHAARVALDPLLLAALQADELEQLVDPGPLAARVDGVELGEIAQVVERRRAARRGRARRRRRSRSARAPSARP